MVAECQGGGGGDFLIKLFGKTIPVPEPESGDAKDLQQSSSSISSSTEQDLHQRLENGHAQTHPDTSDLSPQAEVVDAEDPKSSPETTTTTHHQKPGDGGMSQQMREKLKKPDKVLACPRCSSMDTKFCYFNNYNVNQPRHFCKNCQRYWTAGGAMRNVPVGAGRRKNKNAAVAAASHFLLHHRVRAAAALPVPGGDTLSKTTRGTVLSFGGSHGHGAAVAHPPSHAGSCSEGSSNRDDSNKNNRDEAAAAANRDESVQQQHPASDMSNGATTTTTTVWCPAAAYFSSGIAIPIYPAAAAQGYWGCMVPAGAWSLPWPPVQQPPSQLTTTTTTTSAPSASSSGAAAAAAAAESHTPGGLGKHPRDDRDQGDDDGGRRNRNGSKVWAPKTIRIDDVDEVARSSIWSLIGIKQQDDAGADDAGGQTKPPQQQIGTVFEPKQREAATAKKKAGGGATMVTSSPLLHANPVALTRSVAFQEGSY